MNGRRLGIVAIVVLVLLNAVLIGMLVVKSRTAPAPTATPGVTW